MATKQEPKHQIIRRTIETPMGRAHKVECTCGRQIVMTNSLKSADIRAEEHLESYR